MPDNERDERRLRFLPPAERDYKELPRAIQRIFGQALNLVQHGLEPDEAKALQGFGGRQVLELKENDAQGTYRAVYTVKIAEAIYEWAEQDAERRQRGDHS